mgnify:CR=1 FL=1
MKVGGIGGIPAGVIAAEREALEDRNAVQLEDNMFGPAYHVAISEEGRSLLGEQTAEKEAGGMQLDEGTRMLLRRMEEAGQAKKTRDGYYNELEELERQIKVMNAAYGRMREGNMYDDPLMKELVKQQQLLQEEMQEQKDFQAEEAQKMLKEAQQMAALQTSQYKEEIDENNRDLVTLLKTMEEAKKAEEEQENGGVEEKDEGSSDKENSASDAIHDSASGLVRSSLNHEKGVEELSDMVSDGGRYFLSEADDIAQNLLKKGRMLKAVVRDEDFTVGQIEEAMKSFRSEVKVKLEDAYILGSFGTQILRDMRDARLQHIADDPLWSMQQTKDGMMQAATDAAIGEARQSSIDEASEKLADEMQRLIDERNGIDRISADNEKEETGTEKMPEEQLQKAAQ